MCYGGSWQWSPGERTGQRLLVASTPGQRFVHVSGGSREWCCCCSGVSVWLHRPLVWHDQSVQFKTIQRSTSLSGLSADFPEALVYVPNVYEKSQPKLAPRMRTEITDCCLLLWTGAARLPSWIFIARRRRAWYASVFPFSSTGKEDLLAFIHDVVDVPRPCQLLDTIT